VASEDSLIKRSAYNNRESIKALIARQHPRLGSKYIVAVLVASLLASKLLAQQLDPTTKWATIAEYEDTVSLNVVYQKANNIEVRLDVITAGPRAVVRPTLIYFHGGGWMLGSKEGTLFYMLPYLAHGMDTVNVEYRMTSQSVAPAAVEDARCALYWVYSHAAQYGFDTSKLVVSGHSAGGHLALLTGLLQPGDGFDNSCWRSGEDWRQPRPSDVKVAAIVNFFGPTDVAKLIGGPTTREYAVDWFAGVANPEELARRLSPITYAHPGVPPVITISGDNDSVVPYTQEVTLHEALDRAGVPNQLLTIHGGGHGSTPPFVWTREQNLEAQEAVFLFLEKQKILSPTH
jgi:acetyl esterase/lipase